MFYIFHICLIICLYICSLFISFYKFICFVFIFKFFYYIIIIFLYVFFVIYIYIYISSQTGSSKTWHQEDQRVKFRTNVCTHSVVFVFLLWKLLLLLLFFKQFWTDELLPVLRIEQTSYACCCISSIALYLYKFCV